MSSPLDPGQGPGQPTAAQSVNRGRARSERIDRTQHWSSRALRGYFKSGLAVVAFAPVAVLGFLGLKKIHDGEPQLIDPFISTDVRPVFDNKWVPRPSGEGLAIGGVIVAVTGLSLGAGRSARHNASLKEVDRLRAHAGGVRVDMTPEQRNDMRAEMSKPPKNRDLSGIEVNIDVEDGPIREVEIYVAVGEGYGRAQFLTLRADHLSKGVHTREGFEYSVRPSERGYVARRDKNNALSQGEAGVVGYGYRSPTGHQVQFWDRGSGFRPGTTIVDGVQVDTTGIQSESFGI